MEEEFGKDVCDFIKPEIIKLLISFNASSSQTVHVRRSLLRQYTEFCCNRKLSLDSINHFEEINTEEIEDCVNVFLKERRYITPDTLSDLCEQLLNPVDKYIICALYEGIKGKNCEELQLKAESPLL